MTIVIDAAWLSAHPLPEIDGRTDKNERGRVLVVGGSAFVPGALRLTGEAALRVGAGKLQLATVESAAMALGVLVPEAAMIALPHDAGGDLTADAAEVLEKAAGYCNAMILGPGVIETEETKALITRLLAAPRDDLTVVLDAGCLGCARHIRETVAAHGGRVVMTPHHGEMAQLMDEDADAINDDAEAMALAAARRFNAVIALKAAETLIAAPTGELLRYASHCPGLATGGSGDVLAGVIGGLAARGADALTATAHGVWLHGEAGRALSAKAGAVGLLARDLPAELPHLLEQASRAGV